MPYITQGRRAALLSPRFLAVDPDTPIDVGEVNFMITTIVKEWLGTNPNYTRFNAAIGALECAKLELYRRMIAPYEDTKIQENGDVY